MKILNKAKSLDRMGNYVISESVKFEKGKMYLYSMPFKKWVECDESTRSINFEDMLDSENNPIFASLSEDGKGGDIIEKDKSKNTLFFNRGGLNFENEYLRYSCFYKVKIVGIHE